MTRRTGIQALFAIVAGAFQQTRTSTGSTSLFMTCPENGQSLLINLGTGCGGFNHFIVTMGAERIEFTGRELMDALKSEIPR